MAAFEERSCLRRSGRGRPRCGGKGKLYLLRNVSATPEFAEAEPPQKVMRLKETRFIPFCALQRSEKEWS